MPYRRLQKVQVLGQHLSMKELGPGVGRVSTTAHFLINSIMALSIINGPVMIHLCSTILQTEHLLSWGVSQFFVGSENTYLVSEAGPHLQQSGGSIFTGAGSLMGRLFNTTHQHFSSKLHLAPNAFVLSLSSSLIFHLALLKHPQYGFHPYPYSYPSISYLSSCP